MGRALQPDLFIKVQSTMASKKKPGLYANIHAKQERIKNGSDEKMRKPGDKDAPSKKDLVQSGKTAKKSRD